MTDLHDLINTLTRPHDIAITQHGRLIGHRTQRPLLELLANACIPANETGAGSTNSPHERLPLNAEATQLHTAIHNRIRSWAHTAAVPSHWALANGQAVDWRNPTALLRAWHTRAIGDAHINLHTHEDTLRGWITAITDLVVDPPRKWTIAAPCPLCGQRWTLDTDGNQVDALTVAERDPITRTITTCRHCDTTWHGLDGARHLRTLIDDAQLATA